MIRVNYHITDQQLRQLKAESVRTGLSVAELIRGAIDARLARPMQLQTLGELIDQINSAFDKIDQRDKEGQRKFLEKLGMSTRLFHSLVRNEHLRRFHQDLLVYPVNKVNPQWFADNINGFGTALVADLTKWIRRFLTDKAKID